MMETTPMFGILLVALVAALVLGLLALLVFLVIARHRLLGLIVLGFVLLFVGLPVLLFLSASRQAAYQERRAAEHVLLRAREFHARALSDVERERARIQEIQLLEGDRLVHPGGPHPPAPPSPPGLIEATAAIEPVAMTEANAASQPIAAEPAVAEVATQTELSFWQADDLGPAARVDVVMATEASPAAPSDPPGSTSPAEPSEPSANADPTGVAKSTWSTAAAETGTATVVQPAWVQNPPETVENQPAEVIASDLFETGDECEQDLEHRIQAAIELFAERHCRQLGINLRMPLPIQLQDLRHVARDRFVDVVPTSVGPMKRVHQLIVFDQEFCQILERRVSEAVIGRRLSQTGVFSGGVLLLVGSLFGILKGASRRRSKVASA